MIKVLFNRDKFNALIKKKGKEKKWFIAKTHYTRASWYYFINHCRVMELPKAEKLAKILGVSVKKLFDFPEYVTPVKGITDAMETRVRKYCVKQGLTKSTYKQAVKLKSFFDERWECDLDINLIFKNYEKFDRGERVYNREFSRSNTQQKNKKLAENGNNG